MKGVGKLQTEIIWKLAVEVNTVGGLAWDLLYEKCIPKRPEKEVRNAVRRALYALEERGLVERKGVITQTTGGVPTLEDMKANPQRALTVENFASTYIGQRVPKGYTRETTEWALTKSGKKLFKAQEEAYLANP